MYHKSSDLTNCTACSINICTCLFLQIYYSIGSGSKLILKSDKKIQKISDLIYKSEKTLRSKKNNKKNEIKLPLR